MIRSVKILKGELNRRDLRILNVQASYDPDANCHHKPKIQRNITAIRVKSIKFLLV